jgi:multidrug efflux pump subunit AcrB
VSSDDGTLLRAPDGRLRAWLRITLAVLAFLVAGALTGSVGLLFDSLAVAIAVAGLSSGIVLVALFVWFARRLDRRPIRSYGLQIDRSWWLDLMVGAAIGVLIALLTFAGLVLGSAQTLVDGGCAGHAASVERL